MSTAGNKLDGTDIKGESTLQKRDLIETFNKTGLFGVVIFAPLSFLLTCVWFGKCDLLYLTWGQFGLHILLMSGAFLMIGPMAAVTYRLLVDQFMVKRKMAMRVHGFLQLAATAVGVTGVRAVWLAHESSYHFKTSHSIMGIFGLSIYMAQLLAAAYIYHLGSKDLRRSFKHLHMAIGQGLVVVMVYVASLGTMYFESESYSLDWDVYGEYGYYRPYMTVAQYSILFLMFSLILVFYAQILV